ncbi:MAG: nucleotidyl transferase AbiEii/AbiGii toxin family protein [Candidatus Aminicenantes bacterium]|nr:nucleotidyl transferase AbiEii/AbiGii toxin family protein [Candidatus Aminicenantes bacterium]
MNGEKNIKNLKEILTQILESKILPQESYLAGGTALYFYLHHRLSIDLDFFTSKSFKSESLAFKMRERFDRVDVEIMEKESLILFLSEDKIKFSLFHFPYKLLSDIVLFKVSKEITCPLVSFEDIEAMKAVALTQRGSARDFVDLFYLLQQTKHTFENISVFVQKKYQLEKKYAYQLKTAMVYFDDAEKEINTIITVDQSGRIRKMTQKEWKEIKQFFMRFCR